ncbi:MAG TPA: LTA synthase family protein [Polyangiaceae bacterium]|nr:LTA synthase family protein [Polyangiaceae bacterium]
MKQDFRPEDIATALRWLVSIDAALAFAACALLALTLCDRRKPRPDSLRDRALPLSIGLLLAALDVWVLSSSDVLPPELTAHATHAAHIGHGALPPHGSGPLAAGLLLAAGLAAVLAAPVRALAERVPERFRAFLQYGVLAFSALCSVISFQHVLETSLYLEHLPETLTPTFAPSMLIGVPLALLTLGGVLRLLHRLGILVPVWARMTAEAVLVPATYVMGLSIIYVSLTLTDLEIWQGFKHAAFFSAAVFALPVALVPGAFRARGFGIVMGLFLLIVFGDLIYLRYFGNILPVLAISSGGQIWDVRDIIFKYTQRRDAVLLPAIVASFALPFLWPKTPKADAPIAARGALDFVLACSCIAAILPIPGIVQGWMDSDRSWKVLNGTDAVQDSGIVVAHIKEVARSIRDARQHSSITPDEFAKVQRFHEARAQEGTSDPDFGLARGTNLLILQVEAMQKWVIGAHDRGQEITPFLNRLRDRSWSFEHLYDETGDSSTSDCEYMVLNSQFPIPQGSVAFRRDENHFVTLLHAFKEAGYTTFAGHAYAAGMWNRAVLYPKYGYDQTAFRDELGEGPKLGWGIGDKLFFERVMPRIRKLKQPFVSVLITLTSHGPYQYVPAGERKLNLGAIDGSDFGGYLHSMRYNDEAIEQLFGEFRNAGLLDNTTVVIYGDHDSRMKFPASLEVDTDLPSDVQRRLAIRDYTTKQIPLLIVLPERLNAPPRVVQTVGGQVDIGATIVHLFGLKRPGSFIGQSLVPEHVGHASRIDGSGVDGQKIYTAPGGGRCESFPDLKRLDRTACAELSQKTQEELNMSWDVTLLDLAPKLAGEKPEKAAAKR